MKVGMGDPYIANLPLRYERIDPLSELVRTSQVGKDRPGGRGLHSYVSGAQYSKLLARRRHPRKPRENVVLRLQERKQSISRRRKEKCSRGDRRLLPQHAAWAMRRGSGRSPRGGSLVFYYEVYRRHASTELSEWYQALVAPSSYLLSSP
jgi:hypothetical protein